MENLFYKSILMLLLVSLCSNLSAQIHVNHAASNGGDGSSWASAYNSLVTALGTAGAGDEVWVAQGSYIIISSTDDSFEVPSGAKVYGGFLGINTETLLSDRDWVNNETILDGIFNIHTIVYFEDSNDETTLDGFTIKDGYADGSNSRGESGAGIFINNGSPNIVNCTIKDNTSVGQGGAIYLEGSFSRTANPKFTNCLFEGNASMSNGGVAFGGGNNDGTCNPVFDQCTFLENTSAESGGAFFFNGVDGNVSTTFKKCNFDSNTASGNGGAIYTLAKEGGQGNHILINCRLYKNKGFAAGGMYNHGGDGGDASPIITNCTFYLNEPTAAPTGLGGALYNNAAGGGNSSPIVSNSIIYGNIGPFGSHVFRNIDGTPTIMNSLVDAADCDALNSGDGSNVTCGSGMIYNQDPLYENTATGDLRLQNGSPAIDAGDDNDNNETLDLDCGQRKINTIDMGAYEAPDQSLPVDLIDFNAFLDKDKVTIYWVTLSEENNARFIIERSSDGYNFEDLLSITGAGTTTLAHSYKEYDRSPLPGTNYYRLKNISFAGEIEYSDIRIVEMSNEKINVYPNPVEDHLTITFSDFKTDEANFAIYNVYGKLVYQGTTQIENEVSFISLSEIGSFVPGYYILKVQTSRNGQFSHRFQKIRD